jgi:hypothetical protein
MSTEGGTLSVLPYRCSICPPLLTYRAPDKRSSHMLNSLGKWPWPSCLFCSTQAATLLEFHVPLTNCFVRRWFCVVHDSNLHCTIIIDSVWANFKIQNAFLFPVHTMFHHDCPLVVEPASTPQRLVHKKKIGRVSLPTDMLLPAVSVLVVA